MWFTFSLLSPRQSRHLFSVILSIFQPRARRDSIVWSLWSLVMRRFTCPFTYINYDAILCGTTLVCRGTLHLLVLFRLLPDCFLSISSLARDHANAIYLSHFHHTESFSPHFDSFSTSSFAKNNFSYVSSFGSFLIFARLRIVLR